MVCVFLICIVCGQFFFVFDCCYIYYLFVDFGFSYMMIMVIFIGVSIFFIILVVVLDGLLGFYVLLLLIISLVSVLMYYLYWAVGCYWVKKMVFQFYVGSILGIFGWWIWQFGLFWYWQGVVFLEFWFFLCYFVCEYSQLYFVWLFDGVSFVWVYQLGRVMVVYDWFLWWVQYVQYFFWGIFQFFVEWVICLCIVKFWGEFFFWVDLYIFGVMFQWIIKLQYNFMEFIYEILECLEQLEEKYFVMGQDILFYLDGLLYVDYFIYWDYIYFDILLSL